MIKAAALAKPVRSDDALSAVLRFVLVSGCASALILARYPLPI
jgi:hypothetical protein